MRLSRRSFLFAPVAFASVPAWAVPAPAPSAPLWQGARYTHADKKRAIRRGLDFIYRTAKDEKNYAEYGSDYLWCFYTIAATTSDPDLKAYAGKMARERARA